MEGVCDVVSLISNGSAERPSSPPKTKTNTHARTRAQGIVGRAEGWEGQIGDLETALMLLGASPEEAEGGGDQEGCVWACVCNNYFLVGAAGTVTFFPFHGETGIGELSTRP